MTYGDGVIPARRWTALTLTAALTVAAAAPALASGPSAPAAAPAARDVPAELAPYYTQSLDWTACGGRSTCAWLTVPRDYDNPTGPTIRLRLSRVTASGPASARIGSLVVNPGGPGASGLDFASYLAGSLDDRVTGAYDIVGFDTRGVGRSAPITCMTGPQTTRWLRADITPDTAVEERRLMSLGARLADGCLRKSPGIARHVGSENTARDLDVMRAALGDERLNFLGYSYGTYLGTLYAEAFPQTVGRFVLDGAVDPSLDVMQISQGQSEGFQVALGRFARDCVKHSSCPWRGSAATVIRGINRILAKVERTPLPSHNGRDLVQSEAITAIFYSMYSRSIWPTLRQALRQAKIGDGMGLALIADFAADRTGPNTYANNMASAFPAIGCWDSPPAPGADGLREAARAWSQGARVPELARAMSWGNAACSAWYGHAARGAEPARTSTTAPILVIGTTFDPATPYAWAKALSRQLPTSTLLTYRGDGHTVYGGNSRCIDGAVDDYLLTGNPPKAGTVCR